MTSVEQHFFADNVGDFLARRSQVFLSDRVGGRVYCLAAVESNSDEGNIDRRRYAQQRPYLDLTFYARLYGVSMCQGLADAAFTTMQRTTSCASWTMMVAQAGDVPE